MTVGRILLYADGDAKLMVFSKTDALFCGQKLYEGVSFPAFY